MTDNGIGPEEIAKRAMELAARAEELARHAHETAGIDEQLAQLEAELDALDAEEAGLGADDDVPPSDDHTADDAHSTREASGRAWPGREWSGPEWADALTERVGSLGDRIGALVEEATEAAMHRVEARLGSDGADTVEEHSVDVQGPTTVRVQSLGGPVHVEAHDEATVAVTAHGRASRLDSPLAQIAASDGTVTITSRSLRRRHGRGVRLDVRVPVGTALVVTTGGGSIHVDDVRGPADLRTGGGGIRLAGARDRATVTTGGGGIDIAGLEGTVTARTGGGSIQVDGRLTGSSSLRSGGGNVTVRVAEGTSIRVDGRGTASATDIDSLEAHRGRITGTIGDGSGGVLDVKTGGGTIRIVR